MSDTKESPKKEMKPLSASRIKNLESCSFSYYCNYELRLPQTQNDGARMGQICHLVFELLLNKKHYPKFKAIIKAGTVTTVKSIERIIKIYAKKEGLVLTSENFLKIDQMILVGLTNDFFVEGGTLIAPEFRFDIQNEKPKYSIRGFIDKPYAKENEIIIDDFKSSKKKFEGEEISSSIQGLMYSLAAKKLWPDKKPKVRFIFLAFPEDPMIPVSFNDNTLKGFEYYLESIQEKVDNFTEKDSLSNMAAKKGHPTDKTFGGILLCGYGKHPGHAKKTGEKYWVCSYKWPYDYYVILEDGKIVKSFFIEEKDKNPLKEGQILEKRHFSGCPAWNPQKS